jgi:hypothetical protein
VYFTSDGKEIYYSKYYGDYRKHDGAWKITCIKQNNGRWGPPVIIAGGLTPFLAPDDKNLFFSSEHGWHLFVTEKQNRSWSEPRNLGPLINFSRRQDVPCVTKDLTLYFSARGAQSINIYRSRLIKGKYSKPEKLGSGINSRYNDYGSFVDPDQTYIIFTSFRPGNLGLGDLYISFHLDDETWTKPINMGSKINTKYKERFPCVSPDGKYLFFNSNRPSKLNSKPVPDGPGNIFWISTEIINRLRKKSTK